MFHSFISAHLRVYIARMRQQCHNSKSVIFQEKLLKVLKCYNVLWVQQRHNCSPAASFANCIKTLYLLKVHLQKFLSTPITQKCPILSCDTHHKWAIYIYTHTHNFIHNILIKTIKNGTFKQFVETTALVHAFIGNGNTLINSQPSSRKFWSLFFNFVSNLSCHQQMATFHFITSYMHNNK